MRHSAMNVSEEEADMITRLRAMNKPNGLASAGVGKACIGAETESADAVLARRIDNDFSYHRPTPDMLPKFAMLRIRGKELAQLIRELVPYGREFKHAILHLEETIMHANAGIARGGPVDRG